MQFHLHFMLWVCVRTGVLPTQDIVAFLLSPEAHRLRPLLVQELVTGLDFYARDRVQRAYDGLPSLAPRIPFLGPIPMPVSLSSLPVFVPGLGLQPVQQLVQKLAPPLAQTEEVYLQSLLEVAAGLLGELLDLYKPDWRLEGTTGWIHLLPSTALLALLLARRLIWSSVCGKPVCDATSVDCCSEVASSQ